MKLLLLVLALWGAAASPLMPEPEDIVGGHECPSHSVPWQVYLTVDGIGQPMCGGSLINEWWILSAAHCYGQTRTLVAHLGEDDWTQEEGTEQTINAKMVVTHPDYNAMTTENDIMLIKLAQPVTLNQYVSPIPLPSSCPAPGTWCQVSGWGRVIADLALRPKRLQCLEEPILPDAQCEQVYNLYASSMLCVGIPDGGKSSCKGDSGGPLVCDGQLQGIVSWGKECALAGYPSVYTKVCNYVPWILNVMSSY